VRVSLFSQIHFLMLINSSFATFINSCIDLLEENVHVSSAYVMKLSLEEFTISLIYIRKRTGPRIQPWGTPWLMRFWKIFASQNKQTASSLISMKQTNHTIYHGYRSVHVYEVKWCDLLYRKLLIGQKIFLMWIY